MNRELESEDLARALELFGSDERYHALDVFADDLSTSARAQADAGAVTVAGKTYRFRVFDTQGVVRMERLPGAQPTAIAAGAVAGAAIGAAVTAAARQKGEGLAGGLLLGLLVGGAIGAALDAGSRPQRVFALEFDPNENEWLAYDGSLLRWMKQHLMVQDAA